jgi:hypothetical protein
MSFDIWYQSEAQLHLSRHAHSTQPASSARFDRAGSEEVGVDEREFVCAGGGLATAPSAQGRAPTGRQVAAWMGLKAGVRDLLPGLRRRVTPH